jgi:hypothetical protein
MPPDRKGEHTYRAEGSGASRQSPGEDGILADAVPFGVQAAFANCRLIRRHSAPAETCTVSPLRRGLQDHLRQRVLQIALDHGFNGRAP